MGVIEDQPRPKRQIDVLEPWPRPNRHYEFLPWIGAQPDELEEQRKITIDNYTATRDPNYEGPLVDRWMFAETIRKAYVRVRYLIRFLANTTI